MPGLMTDEQRSSAKNMFGNLGLSGVVNPNTRAEMVYNAMFPDRNHTVGEFQEVLKELLKIDKSVRSREELYELASRGDTPAGKLDFLQRNAGTIVVLACIAGFTIIRTARAIASVRS